ncbi:MAG: tetratricopeptide repeat protein [Acidobacteria bacterium]|nr:tetratricopeptide repeat protein [Acidobacteriota bacterium]
MAHKSKPVRWLPAAICAALVAVNLFLFGEVVNHGFCGLDDSMYLTENPAVQAGLTWAGVRWAFTSLEISYWQPLTYLSHMAGWELFGPWAGGHHVINLLLHILSSVLTFLALRLLTGAVWRSAAVAALFAFHPLHVETVAWLANRQDALASVFWLAAIWAWAWYAAKPSAGRYAAVALMFALGLMSKPMVATLPAILLLLDYWPLGRGGWKRLVLEKIPLALVAAPAIGAAYIAEHSTGATKIVADLTAWDRFANAAVSYAAYLIHTVWPAWLAVLYPYERQIAVWRVAGALLLLAGVAWAARRSRCATVGLLWFAIGLLPAIGLIQVGFQSRADRYTYIPLTGLFVAMVWTLAEMPRLRRWAPLALVPLCLASGAQIGYWRSNLALFQHAVEVTGDNVVAENNLGQGLLEARRFGEAIPHLEKAARLDPRRPEVFNNLGVALFHNGRYREALEQFDHALRLLPDYGNAGYNRARALRELKRTDEALAAFVGALDLQLGPVARYDAHNDAGSMLANSDRLQEALPHFARAIVLDPARTDARKNLAIVFYKLGRKQEAAGQLRAVLQIDPSDTQARQSLEVLERPPS